MINRPLWIDRITAAWRQAPVAWLTGVRRTGKTVLGRSLPEAEFLNCDLPSTAERLADPESFFGAVGQPVVVLDEVHQLPDPSRLLKIAADAFPELKVLATGSSTLAATQKFRDSLTGRKRAVHLVPVLHEELPAFGIKDLRVRLLRGGLPAILLGEGPTGEACAEWLDSYFARDVQELFRLEKRGAFLRLVELILRQSGGLLEVTSLSRSAGVSRPTVMAWLDVLEITHVAHLLRPYAEGGKRELVAQPRAYGFDTGFVCHARGWESLRAEDCGLLWEHLVLDTLLTCGLQRIHYWRDKQQREVDFVLPRGRGAVDALECKWSAEAFEPRGLLAFRESYPRGRNLLVVPRVAPGIRREVRGLTIEVVALDRLRATLAGPAQRGVAPQDEAP